MMLTGLSGNEIYCLAQKGWAPGNIVVGNSVYSLGVLGGFTSGLRTLAGGEVTNITEMISDGRHAAIKRLEDEAQEEGAHGLTGVVSELKTLGGLTEFLAIGSAIKGKDYNGPFFTTACSGQDLFCQIDAGYAPRHFVIGNVAYALGVTR
ncbi:MAG: heavy metal-binding domain-containing protein, partial [Planctomycetes bacterium]|nr:heavy metal-binding domain-containing protein [Planctomycetota bacterium]